MRLGVWLASALFVLMACSRADQMSGAAAVADPCAIALAPHGGTDAIDQEIARLQAKAGQRLDRLTHLERLGWAFVSKARVAFDPGFYKLAEQVALCMTADASSGLEARLIQGHALHSLHRFHEAEAVARDLVARRGRWFDHGLLGDALMEQGKVAEAARAYQAMMDERPSPEAYVRAAHVRWTSGDLAGAISLTRMAIGTSGFRDREAVAWANTRLALYELQAGHREEAARRIDVALAAQADYAPALLARGRLHLAAGDAERAVESLSRATRINPLPEYQWALIEALRESGRADDAGRVEAALVAQGAVNDRRTFALYLASSGRDATVAVQAARQELETRGDALTLDALAWALRSAGEVEEARAFSDRALAQGTVDARLLYHAAAIATDLGRRDDAARALTRARAIEQMLLPSERAALRRLSLHQGPR
jgi:tetratricopeptide (TPR) repeat protein